MGYMLPPVSDARLPFAFSRQSAIWSETVHHIRQCDIQTKKNLGLGQAGFLGKLRQGFMAKSCLKRVNAKGHVRLVRYPTVGRVALTRSLEAVNQITQSGGDGAALKELPNLGNEAAARRFRVRSGCCRLLMLQTFGVRLTAFR